mmetsp:Transcript_4239/g.13419  ORF Transcript_4239/g.13419 Transcript_4239/m.13419 type:complete len:141 (-) Transcript_4239:91-513(-)
MIRSASRIVLSRCATIKVVRDSAVPRMSSSSAAWTSFSLWLSSADVASSSKRMAGLRMSARAIAMRCFWPPLIDVPLAPHGVSYCAGNSQMNLCALAHLHASTTSSNFCSSLSCWASSGGIPNATFSAIVPLNNTGCWST